MSVIIHPTPSASIRHSTWRWLVAIVVGLGIGLAAGIFAYEPALRLIVGKVQLAVGPRNDFFLAWFCFVGMAGVSGAVIGCSSAALGGRGKMWLGWLAAFSIIFFLRAAAVVMYVHADCLSQASRLHGNAPAVAMHWPPSIPANAPSQPMYQFAAAPMMKPLLSGCTAVLLSLGLVMSIRWLSGTARRSAGRD